MKKDKIIKTTDLVCEYALYLLIFTLPFSKAGMQFFCWLAIFAWIIKKTTIYPGLFLTRLKAKTQANSTLSKFRVLLFVFCALCFFSTLFSADIALSSKALFTKVLKYVLLFFVVVETINSRSRMRAALVACIISVGIVLFDASTQYMRNLDFLRGYSGSMGELRASFSNRNGFGGWLIIQIFILFGTIFSHVMTTKKFHKLILMCMLTGMLFCLLATYSRSSWFGFAVASLWLSANMLFRQKIRKKILFVAVLVIAATVVFFALPNHLKGRIISVVTIKNSSLFRIYLWKESLNIIADFPLFGVGLNTYAKIAPYYSKGEGGYYAHNSYLQMTSEIGMLGLLSFLTINARLLAIGIRTYIQTHDFLVLCLCCSVLAFLTQSFFDVNFYALQLATLFWFVMGLTMARINLLTDQTTIAA